MSEVNVLNTRRVDIPVDTAACNKVLSNVDWSVVSSNHQEVYPVSMQAVDTGNQRIDVSLEASVTTSGTPARRLPRTGTAHPKGLVAVGVSDEGDILTPREGMEDVTTMGLFVSIEHYRRNSDYPKVAVAGHHGLKFFDALADGYSPISGGVVAQPPPDHTNIVNIANYSMSAISRLGHSYFRAANGAPLYAGILTSDSLNANGSCGGMVTRIGGGHDKEIESLDGPGLNEHIMFCCTRPTLISGISVESSPAYNIARAWRLLQRRPALFANSDYRYRVSRSKAIARRYDIAVMDRPQSGIDNKTYVRQAFKSKARRPASRMVVKLNFYMLTPYGGRPNNNIVELPADTKLTLLMDNGPVSDAIIGALSDKLNSYWDGVSGVLEPVPIAELVPSQLFSGVRDKKRRLELMDSPFIRAAVRQAYSGWCYDNPVDADSDFTARPPVSMRRIQSVPPRMARKFDAVRLKLSSLLETWDIVD